MSYVSSQHQAGFFCGQTYGCPILPEAPQEMIIRLSSFYLTLATWDTGYGLIK